MNKFVFKKVAELTTEKTELAEVKVDLALVDDLNKLVSKMKIIDGVFAKSLQKAVNSLSSFSKIQNELKDSYNQAILDSQDAKNDIKEAVTLVDKISKQAKELGINPNDIKGTKDVVDVTANIEDNIAILNRNESDFKKILSI